MAALSCLLDSVRRDIKKVDRELRQLRCIDELSARCLCDLYMHPYCCCDLHPYPYCLCYSKRSRSCGLCDLYPCCLCDVKLYCLRPSLRSLERKAIRAIEDEKRELAKLRRTTNRILASSCCSSNILGSVNVCGFEPDQVKVRVKDGKVCVSAERENRYDCLGSKKYSYMNICKEFSLPPCVDEKDVTYSYGLGSCVKIESPCYPCASPCNPCNPCNPCSPCSPCNPCNPCSPCSPCSPCNPCDPCNPCYPCGSRFSCRKMIL
ncbi:PREDICTED: outer dense fiber protein 1 [Bison bison bison]|uniref:Outer dense fiber protein 1 n=3 Tax=Bovinae TaxID=27592 RepID=F1MZM5_BOVIN|nr:outer dense fiber protein 1 [Bos taurus]XP_010861801.1 PREDICTED: outer dense fiber protein 1 [Bison bison bison]XP_061295225.1 outer dense fiber protein 1 [Bos javanicus]DAA22612.1 TPA: outer dense fiber protein 1 [Bos taurus]